MDFVIPPPPPPSVAVRGSHKRFPVRRIFCVGRNYAAHAREMGKDPEREPPFFFMKPADAVIDAPGDMPYPPQTGDLHHEVELVVALGGGGENVAAADTAALIWGYGVGLDMTRRDLQGEAKTMGRPWDWGKGFDCSAPIGPLAPITETGEMSSGHIWLDVDGKRRQSGDIADLIWSIPELMSLISRSMRLQAGDLIMTGTPAGVAAVQPGDTITAGAAGLEPITVKIV